MTNNFENYAKLWAHLRGKHFQFMVLLVLMIICSVLEVVSIGAALPFLTVISNPQALEKFKFLEFLKSDFALSTNQLLVLIICAFMISIIIAGGLRLVLLRLSANLAFEAGSELSLEIYKRSLFQTYSAHAKKNSSIVIHGILEKTSNVINYILFPILTLLSSGIILCFVIIILIFINVEIALFSIAGFGLIYFLIIRLTKMRLLANGRKMAHESSKLLKYLQEAFGGIRDIIIDGSQLVYLREYKKADIELRKSQASNLFISNSPKYIVETLGMILMTLLAWGYIDSKSEDKNIIALLGTFAIAAQRMVPLLQQGFSSWANIKAGQETLGVTIELLNQPLTLMEYSFGSNEGLNFKNKIELENVSFAYDDEGEKTIKNVSLVIQKGSRVGIVGATGSGKSTLVDIIMGLLNPQTGSIWVDGVKLDPKIHNEWYKKIAHVPQFIYLSDGTIKENIAFGSPLDSIDMFRIEDCIKRAQLTTDIAKMPMGLDTLVGERGVRLSGGQRQRIGLARALYKQASVIVLDEATSALDMKTEALVMNSIQNLPGDITLIMVAHRVETLNKCNQLVELENGEVVRNVSYLS